MTAALADLWLSGLWDLDAAVTSTTRSYAIRVLADWNRDGGYSHAYSELSDAAAGYELDRSGTSGLPAEVWLVEGYFTGSLRLSLAGLVNGVAVKTLLNTYLTGSPLAGVEVIGVRVKVTLLFATAVGQASLAQFTGVIRSIASRSSSRVVEVELLDLASTLRAPITLPAFGTYSWQRARYNLNLTMNTQWVVDRVLRANGYYSSPAPGAGAIHAATFHGGLSPEVGYSDPPQVGSSIPSANLGYTPSNFGTLLASPAYWAPAPVGLTWGGMTWRHNAAGNVDLKTTGNGLVAGFWIYAGATMAAATPAGERQVLVLAPWPETLSAGAISLRLTDAGVLRVLALGDDATATTSGTVALSGPQAWHYIGVWVRNNGTTLDVQIRVDATTFAGTMTKPVWAQPARACLVVAGNMPVPISNLSVVSAPSAPTTWPSQALPANPGNIGVGANNITWLPDVVGRSSADLLAEVVTSEFARFWFDENGLPNFAASPVTQAVGTPVSTRTVSADLSLVDMATARRIDSVRNSIVTTTVDQAWDQLKVSRILDATDRQQFKIANGASVTFTVFIPYGTDTYQYLDLPNRTTWDDTVRYGFSAVRQSDEATAVTSGITATWQRTEQRIGQVSVVNTSGFDIELANTNGATPALRMYGFLPVASPEAKDSASDPTSIATFGERALDLGSNQWRTQQPSWSTLAGQLVTALKNPVTVLQDVPIVPDPRVRIADVHSITDPAGLGTALGGVVGMRTTWSAEQGMTQTLTYRLLAAMTP